MNKYLFNGYSYILLILCSILYFVSNSNFDITLLSLALFQLLFYFYIFKQSNDFSIFTWSQPTIIVLVGLIIVNYQTFVNIALGFGLLEDYLPRAVGRGYLQHKCLCVSIASMSIFMLSALNYKPNLKLVQKEGYYDVSLVNLFLLISLIYFLVTINIRDFLTGAVYEGTGAADAGVADYGYSERFLDSMIFISLSIYSRQNRLLKLNSLKEWLKSIPLVFWIVISVYLLLRFFSGDRGPVIYTLFGLLFSFQYCTHYRIKLFTLILFGIIGVGVMSVMSYARMQSDQISIYEKMRLGKELMDAIDVDNISPYTQELASSNVCTYIMMDDIERGKIDYKYGMNMLSTLVNSLPGMGVLQNTIAGHRFFNVLPSSTYITISASGIDYQSGFGTTAIADFYYDFGLLACMIGFFLLGLLFKVLSYAIINGTSLSVLQLIFLFKISSLSIYVARCSLWSVIGSALFIMVLFYIVKLFVYKKTHISQY